MDTISNRPKSVGEASGSRRWRNALLFLLLFFLFSYAFVVNAWVGDDAYITFRVVDNFLHGYGLRWNIVERVQAYTHPLWMILISMAARFWNDYFLMPIVVSYVLCAIAFFAIWWRGRSVAQRVLLVALLVSSKAFMDYTSSGLENPLSYLLLVLFYGPFLRKAAASRPAGRRALFFAWLVASFAFVNRQDSVLLYAAPLVFLTIRAWPAEKWRLLPVLLAGTAPAWAWEIFSLVYYGFLFPNTYYAKVGVAGLPDGLLVRHGWAYLWNSLHFDAVTLVATGAGVAAAVIARRWQFALGALSILLYLAYVVGVGGDFMSGRFLTLPFLLAALLLVERMGARWAVAAALLIALAAYQVWAERAPLKTTRSYERWSTLNHGGISDERGVWGAGASLLSLGAGHPLPRGSYVELGRQDAANGNRTVTVSETIGYYGFFAGPHQHVVDIMGLADPLLARLRTHYRRKSFWIGHVGRALPVGYYASCAEHANQIEDPGIREYYDELCVITRGELFSLKRWRYIIQFNLGSKARYTRAYTPERWPSGCGRH